MHPQTEICDIYRGESIRYILSSYPELPSWQHSWDHTHHINKGNFKNYIEINGKLENFRDILTSVDHAAK